MSEPVKFVLLVDLDGTLISNNSYKSLVAYSYFHRFGSFVSHLWQSLRLTYLIALRTAGCISRVCLKQRVQRLLFRPLGAPIERRRKQAVDQFVTKLLDHLNPHVLEALDFARLNGVPTVLTTAALPEYAYAVGERLDFAAVLATSYAWDEPWTENIRDAKRIRALDWLATKGWGSLPKLLISDHVDDLPLASTCSAVWWVLPVEPFAPRTVAISISDADSAIRFISDMLMEH